MRIVKSKIPYHWELWVTSYQYDVRYFRSLEEAIHYKEELRQTNKIFDLQREKENEERRKKILSNR